MMFLSGCEATRRDLKAYLDGELGRLGAWRVRRHLGRCRGCAARLEGLRRLHAALREADVAEAEGGRLARR